MVEMKKPLLFFTAFPGEGHTNPLLKVAHEMIKRGYDVVFHTSKPFKDRIEAMGAEFTEAPGLFDLVDPEDLIKVKMMPQGMARVAYSIKNLFLATIPARTENLEEALAGVRERTDPSRQIIVMTELCSVGVMPFKWGRPAPRGFGGGGDDQGAGAFPRTIGLSAAHLSVRSIDTGPYMLNLPPDSTESGRLRNAMLSRLLDEGLMRPNLEYNAEMMHKAGAATFPKSGADLMSTWFTTPDVTLQMCLAEQEYPLSDLSPKIKFVGCLPRREPRPDDPLPDWWPEILANSNAGPERKKVVFVSQGTIALDYTDLVIPTLKAFADRADEVLVVVALGVPGATLPEDAGQVPPNARIADYLHYDTIMEHADVMVSNAGYGALCHAVVNGVPLVLAGETQDKTESTNRATWAGYALGLYTQKPSPKQVRSGVETVLANEKYKQRALELKALNESQNTIDKIEGWVKEFTA